jgi:putative oxidoreductase
MKKILNNPILSLIARLIIGVVFIYAAIGKIADPHLFAKEISNYGIVMDWSLNLMALILPWIELIIGIFLILGLRLKASAAMAGFLYLIFIAAISMAMLSGKDINCGCFAKHATKVGFPKLLEDIGSLILCIYMFLYPVATLTLDRLFNKEVAVEEEEDELSVVG